MVDTRNVNETHTAGLAVVIRYRNGEQDSLMFCKVTSPLVVNVHSPRIADVKFWQIHPPVVTKVIEAMNVTIFVFVGLIVVSLLLIRIATRG